MKPDRAWTLLPSGHRLNLILAPLDDDPLARAPSMRPWEPWPPRLAEAHFLSMLQQLQDARGGQGRVTE